MDSKPFVYYSAASSSSAFAIQALIRSTVGSYAWISSLLCLKNNRELEHH